MSSKHTSSRRKIGTTPLKKVVSGALAKSLADAGQRPRALRNADSRVAVVAGFDRVLLEWSKTLGDNHSGGLRRQYYADAASAETALQEIERSLRVGLRQSIARLSVARSAIGTLQPAVERLVRALDGARKQVAAGLVPPSALAAQTAQEAKQAPARDEVERLVEEALGLDHRLDDGRRRLDAIVARLDLVPPLRASDVAAWKKRLAALHRKGAKLETRGRGKWRDAEYVVGGETKQPKGLLIGLHGRGGNGDGAAQMYGDLANTNPMWQTTPAWPARRSDRSSAGLRRSRSNSPMNSCASPVSSTSAFWPGTA